MLFQVCLKDYQSITEICSMSDATYSYMHYFANRNADYEHHELQGEKRICLKCLYELEVANNVRYKNWKAEEVLAFYTRRTRRNPTNYNRSTPAAIRQQQRRRRGRLDREDDDSEDEAVAERWRPLNPSIDQQADCPHCLHQFSDERSLRAHIELSHIPQTGACDLCDVTLTSERALKVHYLGVHLKQIEAICDICGHIFYSRGKLDNHRVIHFEERNVRCELCPAKTFKRLQNLRIHMRVHSGLRPYKCPHCSKAYAHHTDCKRHIVSHTGIYAHNCPVCQQGFVKRSELAAHHQAKHAEPSSTTKESG